MGQESGVEPTTRVAVTVTFLRMDERPRDPAPPLPADCILVLVPKPSVGFYRYLYQSVGQNYLWWLRRSEPDEAVQEVLESPYVGLYVLYRKFEPIGFFELDGRRGPFLNLSYFGLFPEAIGQRFGFAFLRAAVDKAWAVSPRAVTVNTCSGDHPRALPGYLRAGFKPVRTVQEIWDIPDRLGLPIPDRLRV